MMHRSFKQFTPTEAQTCTELNEILHTRNDVNSKHYIVHCVPPKKHPRHFRL